MSRSSAAEAPPERVAPRRLYVTLLTLFSAGIVLALILHTSQFEQAGPPDRVHLVAGVDLPPSGVASLGTMEIANPRRSAMVVESVALTASTGVRLFDVAVITPNDRAEHGFYDMGRGFPPEDWPYPTVRSAGDQVPPHEFSRAPNEAPLTLKVMVAVEATQPGLVGFNGVAITYTIDGKTQTEHFAHALLMCSPPVACEEIGDANDELRRLGLLAAR